MATQWAGLSVHIREAPPLISSPASRIIPTSTGACPQLPYYWFCGGTVVVFRSHAQYTQALTPCC